MPYSTGCTTPLSNFEAGLNYKDVPDPAVKVSFPLDDDEDNAEMVIWTTTPWYALHICTLAHRLVMHTLSHRQQAAKNRHERTEGTRDRRTIGSRQVIGGWIRQQMIGKGC